MAPGRRLAHYEILKMLGQGGMGQVFLARDTQLDRKIALKSLPAEFTRDEVRLRRFRREARSVAALSHPNIVTVFSAESEAGLHFLTMEYVPGRALADLIPGGGFELRRFFEIAVPVADAIGAAHQRGITHRDIKPGNIMVTPDGVVKVLDFGLAKLRETRHETPSSKTSTDLLTRQDQVLGTAPYMSPEQLRNEGVDERSDIFSLGIVLYQMATGKLPFKGRSPAELISAIMKDRPPPVSDLRQGLPHHLARIVARCLEKDPDRRYQAAKDLRNDLADLERELDLDSRTAVQAPVRRRWQRRFTLIAAAAAGALIALTVVRPWFPDTPAVPLPGTSRQITWATGWEAEAAISPDGQLLAYVSDQSGHPDIWLVGVQVGGKPIPLTNDPAPDRQPSWFPDGSAIAFESTHDGGTAIWKVPRLGGPKTMLVQNASDPAVSPDGTRIAFAQETSAGSSRIGVADLSSPRQVRSLSGPDDGLWSHRQPAWSPDGRWICYADANDLWLVPADGGDAERLTSDAAGDHEPVWSPDGRFIYFSSYRDQTLALWRVPATGGTAQRLTPGTGPERHPSISRAGDRLAYTTFVDNLSLELIDLVTGERARLPGGRSDWGAAIAPDRTAVAFVSRRGDRFSIWQQPIEGVAALGRAIRLNDEPTDSSNPDYSPDGRWIAYQRRLGTDRSVWALPSSGGLPHPLTEDAGVFIQPAWSADGSAVAYVSSVEGASSLWVLPVDDGRPVGPPRQLPSGTENLSVPNWSPDGKEIAYLGVAEGDWDVWITSADAGAAPRRLTRGADARYLRWNQALGTLLVSALWRQSSISLREVDPLTGDSMPLVPSVEFGPAARYGLFDLSVDGRLLALTREQLQGDVWLMDAPVGSY